MLHGGAVDHHVGDFELAEAEEVLDVLGLALLHLAVLGGDLDQAFDLDVGEDVLMRGLAHAEQPQDRARGGVEQPVERVEDDEGDVERIGDPQRHRLGLADGERLRHLLADDDVQRGEDEEADQEGGEVDAPSRACRAASSSGSRIAATVGSPTQPRPSEAMVMPSWQQAR